MKYIQYNYNYTVFYSILFKITIIWLIFKLDVICALTGVTRASPALEKWRCDR